jgi:hypothetical protein
MPITGTRLRIAYLSAEKLKYSYRTGDWSDSLWRKGIGRPTVEDPLKEFEKASNGRSQDVGMKLQGKLGVTKNEERFGKNPSRTSKSFERSTPSLEGSLAEETRTRQERLMQEA